MPSYEIEKSEDTASEQPRPGFFGTMGHKYRAWVEEGYADADVRILAAQQRVAHQKAMGEQAALQHKIQLATLELDGRRQVLQGTVEVEELEYEVTLRREIRQAPPAVRRVIVGADLEIQKLMLEREQVRQQRRTGTVPTPAPLPAPVLPAPPVAMLSAPVEDDAAEAEVYISDRQIEELALRAVTRFAALEPGEADRQWRRWRQELFHRLPVYAAEEVALRTDEMRGLVRRGTR